MRTIFARDRRARGRPRQRLILIAAEAVPRRCEHQRRIADHIAEGCGKFLIARDAQFRAGAAGVGAGQKRAVAGVSAGVGELETGDDREVLAQLFERLQNRRDGVIGPGVAGVKSRR